MAIAALLLLLSAGPASARDSLVCIVTNRLAQHATFESNGDSIRIFTVTPALVEERQSGTSVIRLWNVVADRPAQLLAIGVARDTDTLTIDPQEKTFVETNLTVQTRGYCETNDLP